MLNIRFKGICKNEEEIKKNSKLYKNSIMFKEEETIKEHVKKGEKIMIPIAIIMFIVTLITADIKNIELEFDLIDIIISILMLIPLVILFEAIIALTYPLKANKDIYISQKDLTIYLISNSLVSKKRFILICLMPIILLAVIPYTIMILFMNAIPIIIIKLIYISSALTCIISSSIIVDIYNTIKQVPKGAKVFNYGFHSYWVDKKK